MSTDTIGAHPTDEFVPRLLSQVSPEMARTLQAAGVLRWFDRQSLGAVMSKSRGSAVGSLYKELAGFPFVGFSGDGHILHGSIREPLDRALKASDPGLYRKLHERAA